MKKVFFCLIAISLIMSCGKKTDDQKQQNETVSTETRKAGTLLFVTEEYPPYEYLENGKPVGCDVDALLKASEMTGIPIEIKFIPWKRAMIMVQDGSADAIFSLLKTAERESFLLYPETPLSLEINRIFTNKTFTGKIWKLSDLDNKTVGVMTDYSYGEEFDNYKGLKKEVEYDQETQIKKLAGNRYQYIVNNELVTFYLMKKLNISLEDCVPQGLVVSQEPLYVAFSKKAPNSENTHKKFSEALQTLSEKGEMQTILKKYVNK